MPTAQKARGPVLTCWVQLIRKIVAQISLKLHTNRVANFFPPVGQGKPQPELWVSKFIQDIFGILAQFSTSWISRDIMIVVHVIQMKRWFGRRFGLHDIQCTPMRWRLWNAPAPTLKALVTNLCVIFENYEITKNRLSFNCILPSRERSDILGKFGKSSSPSTKLATKYQAGMGCLLVSRRVSKWQQNDFHETVS